MTVKWVTNAKFKFLEAVILKKRTPRSQDLALKPPKRRKSPKKIDLQRRNRKLMSKMNATAERKVFQPDNSGFKVIKSRGCSTFIAERGSWKGSQPEESEIKLEGLGFRQSWSSQVPVLGKYPCPTLNYGINVAKVAPGLDKVVQSEDGKHPVAQSELSKEIRNLSELNIKEE